MDSRIIAFKFAPIWAGLAMVLCILMGLLAALEGNWSDVGVLGAGAWLFLALALGLFYAGKALKGRRRKLD